MPPCPRRCCSSYFPSLLNCSVLICHLLFFEHRQYLLLEVNRKATTDTHKGPHPTPHLPCPYGLALLFWIHRAEPPHPTPHHPCPYDTRCVGEPLYSAQGSLVVHALISNVARRWML